MAKIISVRLITNAGAKIKNVSDSTPLRQFYAENNVNYSNCSNTVNSVPVHADDLPKTLGELSGGADEIRISSVVKQDTGAKIYIHANTFEVKSSAKLEDWKRVLKYDPDFGLYDEDDNNYFAAMIDNEGFGSLTKNGVMWSNRTGADGLATASGVIPPDSENPVAAVKDNVGIWLPNLNMLEECIGEALADANRYEKEINDNIVVQ